MQCYAARYPDLLTGYCNGDTEVHKTADQKHEIKSCNYGGLLSHWNNVGRKGRRRPLNQAPLPAGRPLERALAPRGHEQGIGIGDEKPPHHAATDAIMLSI